MTFSHFLRGFLLPQRYGWIRPDWLRPLGSWPGSPADPAAAAAAIDPPEMAMAFAREMAIVSIDWFKGKITGKSHMSWENLWFPLKIFP